MSHCLNNNNNTIVDTIIHRLSKHNFQAAIPMTQRLFQVCVFSSWGESWRVCPKIFITCKIISSAKREDSVDKESPCGTSVTPGFQNSGPHGNSGLVQWPACSHRQGRDRIPRANELRRLAESEKLESSERPHFNIY